MSRVSRVTIVVGFLVAGLAVMGGTDLTLAWAMPGESPALGPDRITQDDVEGGALDLLDIRIAGRKVFSVPFNKLDGFGDGPLDPDDTVLPGGRPTLQGNGTLLRVNGLDSQTCLECHSVLSNATVPARFGVGGVGGPSANVLLEPTFIDPSDIIGLGEATFNGRFINPPFLFGAGGVELVAKEMTADLQAHKATALANPGMVVQLVTMGVSFGTIVYDGVELDTSGVEGIDADLIVRPFGRKGDRVTTRAFDANAMRFHFGIEPNEVVGEGVDGDGDGVTDELLVGEMSALAIFNTTLERPVVTQPDQQATEGFQLFQSIGCASCHKPFLITQSRTLDHSFPEVHDDPLANVYYQVDLTAAPTSFQLVPGNGILVAMFADLKRHDMGPGLEESANKELDSQFTTARLWGVADTGPWLHDGRALTLTDAILLHGGEGQAARDAFANLDHDDKFRVLAFLRTLRTPDQVGQDLDQGASSAVASSYSVDDIQAIATLMTHLDPAIAGEDTEAIAALMQYAQERSAQETAPAPAAPSGQLAGCSIAGAGTGADPRGLLWLVAVLGLAWRRRSGRRRYAADAPR